jgi:hypothetical protein
MRAVKSDNDENFWGLSVKWWQEKADTYAKWDMKADFPPVHGTCGIGRDEPPRSARRDSGVRPGNLQAVCLMRDGNLRGLFNLTCDQCGKESPRMTVRQALVIGWAYAMDSPFGAVGNDWCPKCRKSLL